MSIHPSPENYFQFNLGHFDCLSVSDGSYDYDPNHIFTGMSREEVNELLRSNHMPTDKIVSPYTFLYVNTGNHRVLVDMGAGKLGPNTGKLINNLKAAGIQPEEIDTVIITHAHPDHIGGTLDNTGQPNYPNASYYIWEKEWNFWFSDKAFKEVEEHLSQIVPTELFIKVARDQLGPIRDRIKMIAEESEVLPGVSLYFAPGHTPGHLVVSFSSAGQELYFTSDTVIFPIFLERPDLRISVDILPDIADSSKHHIFNMIAEKKALVLAQHFPPFPSLGHVVKKDKGWRWNPIKI